jgi:Flp pilus assembly protein TadD
LGDHGAAERAFRKTLELDPHQEEAANGLGLALANQNRFAEAKSAFQRAIELRPGYGAAINNLGVLYGTAGDLQNAVAAWQYGVEAAPDDDDIRMNLARGYVAMGRKDKARQVLKDWLERKPGSGLARQALLALEER